jgi:hypothetical protein
VTALGGYSLADTRSSADWYPERVRDWTGLSAYLSEPREGVFVAI